MSIQLRVELGDVATTPSDLLLLKYAQNFYGADEAIALRLTQGGKCTEQEISLGLAHFRCVNTDGVILAHRVLFLGVPPLRTFLYKEIRQFARRAIEIIAQLKLPVQTVTCTVHGAGYGLDIEESLHAMLVGFQQTVMSCRLDSLKEIIIVERNPRRFELLRSAIQEAELVTPVQSNHATATLQANEAPEPPKKKSVFVAMPFQEDFEDVYQFGIYN